MVTFSVTQNILTGPTPSAQRLNLWQLLSGTIAPAHVTIGPAAQASLPHSWGTVIIQNSPVVGNSGGVVTLGDSAMPTDGSIGVQLPKGESVTMTGSEWSKVKIDEMYLVVDTDATIYNVILLP